MKKIKNLNRRTFLRGLYSTAIQLPILDIMLNSHGEAYANGLNFSKNYFTVYSGLALSSGHSQQNNPILLPATTGALTQLPFALNPLDTYGVKNLVQVVSNLLIPYKTQAGGVSNIHAYNHKAQLCGLREDKLSTVRYTSPDFIFANSLAKLKAPLTIGVQASGYNGSVSTVSYNKTTPNSAKKNLHQIYQDLISQYSTSNQEEERKRIFEFKKRGTVLDLVKDDLTNFKKKLGRSDQLKVDRHIASMRDLETKLKDVKTENSSSCQKMPDPGADAPVSSILDKSKWDKNGQILSSQENYSNEKERAKVAVDLAYMSIACGFNPIVNIVGTYNHPWLNAGPITGIETDFHNLTHGGGKADDGKAYDEGIKKAHQWHVDMFANLVNKLNNSQVGDGSLYDQTIGVYFSEAGMGKDYYSYNPASTKKHMPHSGENMMMLVAGNLGGLKPGKHFNANKQHPTKVFISILKSLGLNINTIGEISGHIDDLYT